MVSQRSPITEHLSGSTRPIFTTYLLRVLVALGLVY
jgi:hypothetical protein